jgi:hypothetical protein
VVGVEVVRVEEEAVRVEEGVEIRSSSTPQSVHRSLEVQVWSVPKHPAATVPGQTEGAVSHKLWQGGRLQALHLAEHWYFA